MTTKELTASPDDVEPNCASRSAKRPAVFIFLALQHKNATISSLPRETSLHVQPNLFNLLRLLGLISGTKRMKGIFSVSFRNLIRPKIFTLKKLFVGSVTRVEGFGLPAHLPGSAPSPDLVTPTALCERRSQLGRDVRGAQLTRVSGTAPDRMWDHDPLPGLSVLVLRLDSHWMRHASRHCTSQ